MCPPLDFFFFFAKPPFHYSHWKDLKVWIHEEGRFWSRREEVEQGGLLGRARCHVKSMASSHPEPVLKIDWHFYAGAAVDNPGNRNTWNIQIHPLRPARAGRVKLVAFTG